MKLTTAQVTHFRCIDDSCAFRLDQVTCLVGKNESGKTTLLQALYRLNPDVAERGMYIQDDDYPRRFLSDFDERHPKGPPDVLTTVWELEADDKAALRELVGPEADAVGTVKIYKGYSTGAPRYEFTLSEHSVLLHLLDTSELHDEEKKALAGAKTVEELKSAMTALGAAATPRHAALGATLARFGASSTARQAAETLLASRLPKFVYFSQYHRMSGRIPLQGLRERVQHGTKLEEGERTFIDFCAFAGATLDELANIAKFENLVARFEGASNKITNQIFKYWSQNRHLRVQFSRNAALPQDPPPFNSGEIFNVRIWNDMHQVSVPFDERSAGFVWFFSFLVYFSQVRKTHGDRLIILLDEPGLSLHARAQEDLQRYMIEQLAPNHQVIYTTHSPFMVPSDKLTTVRTVEDVSSEKDGVRVVLGTKVGDDVLSTDKDTLFPLQGALGYEITQTLFVGKHTLLVEGPSDLLYLKAFSEELKAAGRQCLDVRWTICPVGGIDKVAAFMSLFGGNRLHIAVLTDFASGQKKKVEELRRSKLLRDGHVFTAETYAGQPEADTEDIIGPGNYVALVNACFGLGANQAVPVAPAATPRIVRFVEDRFRLLPAPIPEFDHFSPSAFLMERRTTVMSGLPDQIGALARFEKLFGDLNAALPAK